MRYRSFGKTGLRVSELSFGAMTFGRGLGSISKVDEPLAEEMIARAIDAGVNLFDTADVYSAGASEEMLGRALGKRRGDVLVATKVGFPSGSGVNERGLSYRRVVSAAEASLRRLGSDWIDLYQIHKRDAYAPMEETARAFEDLRARGLVRYAGFSNLCAWEAALAIGMQRQHGWAGFVSAQMYYSLVGRDIEHDVVPLLEAEELALLVWSPLAGGFLTAKYGSVGGGNDRRTEMDFPPVDRDAGERAIEALKQIALARGATPAQVALAWLRAKSFVTSVIVGASNVSQLESNLQAADIDLTQEETAALDAAAPAYKPYPASFRDTFPDDF